MHSNFRILSGKHSRRMILVSVGLLLLNIINLTSAFVDMGRRKTQIHKKEFKSGSLTNKKEFKSGSLLIASLLYEPSTHTVMANGIERRESLKRIQGSWDLQWVTAPMGLFAMFHVMYGISCYFNLIIITIPP